MFSTDVIGSSTTSGLSQAEQSDAKLKEDLNQFLELLVTQLQNQDPLEPMDATEFTSQLVQFASVEQQIHQNANLEKILNAEHVSQVSNLAGFLGTTIESAGDSFNLENGTATFTYELLDDASSNTLIIQDSLGKTVYATKGETSADKHTFTWDGKDEFGNQLPDGEYTLKATPQDDAGVPVDYKSTVFGRVSAAGAEEGQVTLYLGDVAVPLGQVLSVSETPATPTP